MIGYRHGGKEMKKILICLMLFLNGCAGATGVSGINSIDPTERGLSYIASAIISAAIISALFNK